MIRLPFLMIALFAIPAFATSEVWRWRDASGQLHYSNIPENVPAYAERVETQLGRLSVPPGAPAPARPREDVKPTGDHRRESSRWLRHAGPGGWAAVAVAPDCCPPYGLQHLLTTTGRSLADQVQEASLLDALNVRWRQAACR